jgi:hypothetical protein
MSHQILIVFKDDTTMPVTEKERRLLTRCGMLARMAVNERWHTDETRIDIEEVLYYGHLEGTI